MGTITEAATTVPISADQLRRWIASGQVAAAKDSRRRWDVDAASLRARLARADRFAHSLEVVGGVRWRRHIHHRVYFSDFFNTKDAPDILEWAGLTFTRHPGGRPGQALLNGQPVYDANGGCGKIYSLVQNVYANAWDETLRIQHWGAERMVYYTDRAQGGRTTVDLMQRIIDTFCEHADLVADEPFKVVGGHAVPLTYPTPEQL